MEELLQLQTFAELCARAGKNEADYAIPENGSNLEKLQACEKRMRLMCKVFNTGEDIQIINTKQWKHTPVFDLEIDKDQAGGFGLSFRCSGCGIGDADLGVRPDMSIVSEELSDHAGKQFADEYKNLLYYAQLVASEPI